MFLMLQEESQMNKAAVALEMQWDSDSGADQSDVVKKHLYTHLYKEVCMFFVCVGFPLVLS